MNPQQGLEAELASLRRQLAMAKDAQVRESQAMARAVHGYEERLRKAEAEGAPDASGRTLASRLEDKERIVAHLEKQLAAEKGTVERLRNEVRTSTEKFNTPDHFFDTVLSGARLTELTTDQLEVIGSKLMATLSRVHDLSTKRIPSAFVCPITFEIMTDPVFCSDGHTYERAAIESWLQNHESSPTTNADLANKTLVANHTLRNQLEQWKKVQQARGIGEAEWTDGPDS